MDDMQIDFLVTAILVAGERAQGGQRGAHSITAAFESMWKELRDEGITGPNSRFRKKGEPSI